MSEGPDELYSAEPTERTQRVAHGPAYLFGRPLGQILVQSFGLMPEKLEEALKVQAEKGGRLGEVLVGMRAVAEEDVTRALSEQELTALRRKRIGFVFQDHKLLFDRNAFENVALPLRVAGFGREETGRRVRAALDKVGLLAREKAMPVALSGVWIVFGWAVLGLAFAVLGERLDLGISRWAGAVVWRLALAYLGWWTITPIVQNIGHAQSSGPHAVWLHLLGG